MAGETGSSTISSIFATDIVSRAVAESLTAQTEGVLGSVWVETVEGTTAIKFGLSATMSASGFTDTTGMSLTAYSPTQATVTAAPIGIASRVTGFAEAVRPDTLVKVGYEHGKGVAVKIATDITALFASLTTNTAVDRTGNTLRVSDFLTAITRLNAAKVPTDERTAVISAKQLSDLMSDSQSTNAYAFQQSIHTGQFGPLWGIPIVMTQTCATDSSAADDIGAMYHRTAIGFGQVRGVQAEVLRAPAQFNATDIATTVYYGVALLDAHRGVKMVSKNP